MKNWETFDGYCSRVLRFEALIYEATPKHLRSNTQTLRQTRATNKWKMMVLRSSTQMPPRYRRWSQELLSANAALKHSTRSNPFLRGKMTEEEIKFMEIDDISLWSLYRAFEARMLEEKDDRFKSPPANLKNTPLADRRIEPLWFRVQLSHTFL